jgi:hypothetical protein
MTKNNPSQKEETMFTFNLGQYVSLVDSGENGRIIGRAEFEGCQNEYLVRYRAADGRAVEAWWKEDALS